MFSELKEKEEKDRQEKLKKLLPKEIECPKCLGPNPIGNEECCFCGSKLNKEKYYRLEYYENKEDDDSEIEEDKESYLFQYVISFLIPLIGFVLGAIMLSNEDSEKVSVGKSCIILGIVSVIVSAIISAIIFF